MAVRKDLLRNKGRIYVFDEAAAVKDWIELTVVDNVKISHPSNPIDVKTPSGISIYKSNDIDAEISFDWYHPGDLSKIELLFRGGISNTAYTGSGSQAETVIVNFRQASEAFPLPGFNGDKSVVTVSAVVLDSNPSTTYALTTDYTKSVDADTGMSFITQVSGGSIPLNTDIRVTYSYTPLKSNVIRPIENGQLVDRFVIIDCPTDPNDSTKYRRYFLPRSTVVSDLMHQMLEFGENNSTPNIMPVSLKYAKPETGKNFAQWYWIDTANA
jgi:hypothetical protein